MIEIDSPARGRLSAHTAISRVLGEPGNSSSLPSGLQQRDLTFDIVAIFHLLGSGARARTTADERQRPDALRLLGGGHQAAEASHRQPDEMEFGEAEPIRHREQILHRFPLPVIGYGLRHVGGEKASRRVGYAAMGPREGGNLGTPGAVIAAELMREQDRHAPTGLFSVEKIPVAGSDAAAEFADHGRPTSRKAAV